MELYSLEFFIALAQIVFLDLVLAGDNAIVIGLAARRLPLKQQKKAIIYGTIGAITIRLVAAILLVTLLKVPWLHLIGGVLLIWIAYKLVTDSEDHDNVKAGSSLASAVWTIIVADALMGIDNVLAISGAARGSYLLVGIGLLISVPIIMWGSSLFIKLVEKFPWIIYLGGGVLAYTAAEMIKKEQFLNKFFDHPLIHWGFIIAVVIGVLLAGNSHNKKHNSQYA
jgi:YjbE family integral membrane protein